MKIVKNRIVLKRKREKGMVLLVALIMTIIFVSTGAVIAKKSKAGIEIAGSNVRYDMVFEATEKSLRNTIKFIQNIKSGEPISTSLVSRGTQDRVANFRTDVAIAEDNLFVSNISHSFVWRPGALEEEVCGAGNCTSGIDFINRLDDNDLWRLHAIKSKFADANDQSFAAVANNSYLLNIRTYTFVQKIENSSSGGGVDEGGVIGGSNTNNETHYLITVRGSGYLPSQNLSDLHNLNINKSKENVVLQVVFVQRR